MRDPLIREPTTTAGPIASRFSVGQTEILADDPAHAAIRRRLEGLLQEAQVEFGDKTDFEGVGGPASQRRLPRPKRTQS